jgi:glycosyltransferase involved in cell wall biosynthesis
LVRKAFFDGTVVSGCVARVSMYLANPYKPDPRVRREASALSRAGHDVEVIAWDRDCRLPAREDPEGFAVFRFRIRGAYGSFLPLLPGFLRFYVGLLIRSLRLRPGVVHCHDMDTLAPGVIVSLLTGARLVYDMHESYPDFVSTFAPTILVRLLRFLEPRLIRRADLVLTTSSMIAGIAREAGAKDVIPIMNCFDPFPRDQEGVRRIRASIADEGEFLVLYIGGLFAGRGLEAMMRAFAPIEGARLFLGGYGPLEGDLRKLAKELGVEGRIVFAGEIDPSEVPDYDLASDLLFSLYTSGDPNNVLTIPNKFFESVAAGKPILVSNVGEKARLVAELGNGLAVDPDDIPAITNALRKLKDDPQLREKMARASDLAQENYNWQRMAKRLVDSYATLTH